MMRIPLCFYCKHYDEEKSRQHEWKCFCKAYPEGIPQMKHDGDPIECANGMGFEEIEWQNESL